MQRSAGRPPKPTKIDRPTMDAARQALLDGARILGVPRRRYPVPGERTRQALQPEPLELAVLATRLAAALEILAVEEVQRARDLDGVTFEEVGKRFGISMQSAHARFRPR